jgi:hypothetical protein
VAGVRGPDLRIVFDVRQERMKKFWRGFRKVADTRSRQQKAKVQAEQLEKLRRIVREGRYEAEPDRGSDKGMEA